MELKIVRADPAGNITIFVLDPPAGMKEREEAVQALLSEPDLGTEQIGFVLPPTGAGGLWRLEMADNEFCGNAGRSFGLLAAAQGGLSGRHTLMIEMSGMTRPLPVHIDTEAHTAEIEIPGPLEETEVDIDGLKLPVYVFEGITHVIAEDIQADERLANAAIARLGRRGALGVMFYDTEKGFMRPAVWTSAMGRIVFESSCGSGSAALGVWAVRNVWDAETTIHPAQPGGVITVSVVKHAGKIERLAIAGEVTLSETIRFSC